MKYEIILTLTLMTLFSSLVFGLSTTTPAFGQTANEIDMVQGSGSSATTACVAANNCFTPNPLYVSPGTTVTWRNTDTVSHYVTSGLPSDNTTGTVFDSGNLIKPGGTYQFTFANAGTYNYECTVHPWMTGQVIVGSAIPPSQTTQPPTITANTDKSSYNAGDSIVVSGTVNPVNQINPNQPVVIQTYDPNDELVRIDQTIPTSFGTYSITIPAHGSLWQSTGTYSLKIQYGSPSTASTLTFSFNPETSQTQSQQIQITSGGTLNVGFSTDPVNPGIGGQTQLQINFLNKQNAVQQHIDYRVSITQGNNQVFAIQVTHTAEGSVRIPFQFQSAGTYQVTVEVQGVLFQPIPPETAIFSINVGGSQNTSPNNSGTSEIDMIQGAGAAATGSCVAANNCFTPNPLYVYPGTTVTWRNTDTVSHYVSSGNPSDTTTGTMFDSGNLIKPGGTYQFTFANAGTYNYFCTVHPWMIGQVIVGNNVQPNSAPPQPSITFTTTTDRSSYNAGDSIVVSGTINPISSTPQQSLIISILNSNNNIVLISQINVPANGQYTDTIRTVGETWDTSGTYTVKVLYTPFNVNAQTTFNFVAGTTTSIGSTEIDMTQGAGAAATADCVAAKNCFIPNPLSIAPGTTVTWRNTDTVSHYVTSGNPSDTTTGTMFDSGNLIKPGSTYQFTFANAGTYNYFCTVHPWMIGQVIVGAASTTPTSIPIPTSANFSQIPMKTYLNQEYNFGILYPSSWTVQENYPSGMGNVGIVQFQSDSSENASLSINSKVENVQLTGNQYLNKMLQDEKDFCNSFTFEHDQYTCEFNLGSANINSILNRSMNQNNGLTHYLTMGIEHWKAAPNSTGHDHYEFLMEDDIAKNTDVWKLYGYVEFADSSPDSVNKITSYAVPILESFSSFTLGESNSSASTIPTGITVSTSQSSYHTGDTVTATVVLSGANAGQNIAVSITDPTSTTIVARTIATDNTGTASMQFKLPTYAKPGTYNVAVTSSVNGKDFDTSTTFNVQQSTPPISIISSQATDQQGNPVSSFSRGSSGYVKVLLYSQSSTPTLVTVNLYGSDSTVLGIGSIKSTLTTGQSEIMLSFSIPNDAPTGTANIFVDTFSDWPSYGGKPLTPESSAAVGVQ